MQPVPSVFESPAPVVLEALLCAEGVRQGCCLWGRWSGAQQKLYVVLLRTVLHSAGSFALLSAGSLPSALDWVGGVGGRSGVLFLFALPVATEEAGSELAFRKHLLNAESRDANTNFHFFQSLDRPHVKHLHVTAVT